MAGRIGELEASVVEKDECALLFLVCVVLGVNGGGARRELTATTSAKDKLSEQLFAAQTQVKTLTAELARAEGEAKERHEAHQQAQAHLKSKEVEMAALATASRNADSLGDDLVRGFGVCVST